MTGTDLYYRPLARTGPLRPAGALPLAGTSAWFSDVALISRTAPLRIVPAAQVPQEVLHRLSAPRAPLMGLTLDRPRLMGILNVTPDSFSDGGEHHVAGRALAHARAMIEQGADLIDVGGESTRPGADAVPAETEIARIEPVIAAMRHSLSVPISIDTRKTLVARVAVSAGAGMVNDISGFTYDPDLAQFCARRGLPVCVMHAKGDPKTMQQNPQYRDVLLDIYDFLDMQVSFLTGLGIPLDRIVVDPGIGFGKTIAHNLTLLAGLSLFHGLGCAVLVGASRKGFIREIGRARDPHSRAPGSVAVGLAALAQGVHLLRVHDVEQTHQAVALWRAATEGAWDGA